VRTSARASATRAEARPENPIFAAFIAAAKSGDQQRVEQGLRADPSIIDMQDENGMTALMYAAQKDHREVIDILIKSGARTNLYNKKYI
jgi:ankyrin repeat protein